MKVKLLTSLAGATLSHAKGDEYPCDAAEAKRLIEAGFAEPVAGGRKSETTVKTVTAAEQREAAVKAEKQAAKEKVAAEKSAGS